VTLKITLAGATGWVGKSLAAAIHTSPDLELTGAIAPRHAQQNLGTILNIPDLNLIIAPSTTEAISKTPSHIFVDFTTPSTVKQNVLTAISHGLHVIIGTSGLAEQDYDAIDKAAQQHKVGVIAAGNFSLTAALMKKFATVAAQLIPEWEIIDYASARKPDAPSGTARELAEALSHVRKPITQISVEQTFGIKETRGGEINATRVHSIRLPGYTLSTEAIFGMPDEKLTLRHDAGSSPLPYVQGVLLAIRKVSSTVGLTRGLDNLLQF
jgi:4-hydroxy-tetrahydrodipicolinate reductase